MCTDREHKAMLWRDGFGIYDPKGIDDEDYCVLKFAALKNHSGYKDFVHVHNNIHGNRASGTSGRLSGFCWESFHNLNAIGKSLITSL